MLNQIKSTVNSALDVGKESLQKAFNTSSSGQSFSGAESMHYPLDLRGEKRPCIEFSCFDTSGGQIDIKTIWFPAPGNISFSDGAQFNDFDLGALGGALDSAIGAAKDAGADGASFIGQLKSGAGDIIRQADSLKSGEIATIAMMATPIGERVSFQAKTIVNPNTNAAFQGNSKRSFSFGFKMIARSQKEANMMKKIHETFRRFTYADSDGNLQNLTLAYPPVWRIRFLDAMANENNYIPKIHSCYLTTFDTTINATNNVFNIGGDPLEIDVSMTYVETRTLTRHDIDTLGDDENRGIDENGQPTVQPTNAQSIEALQNQMQNEWKDSIIEQKKETFENVDKKKLQKLGFGSTYTTESTGKTYKRTWWGGLKEVEK